MSAIKERPIIFSGPMVRAILEGRKTQTRRVIKNPYAKHASRVHSYNCGAEFDFILPSGDGRIELCPYGKPSDRLWVRETWALTGSQADVKLNEYFCPEMVLADHMIFRADCDGYDNASQSWRPSIYMPRWASRIDLEITGIRVERLTDISNADAISEGALSVRTPEWDAKHFPEWKYQWEEAIKKGEKPPIGPLPKQTHAALWNEINGKGSWDTNPWVWVIEFKRTEQ
jgi:hypothetical protein